MLMKCSICGAELEYGSNICKYCGNIEKAAAPELIPEDAPEYDGIEYTRTFDIQRKTNDRPKSEGIGAVLPEIPDKPPVYKPPVVEENLQENYEETISAGSENDMGAGKTRKNGKKNNHPVRTAVIMVLVMIVIFAVTFSVFFRLLGGSFSREEPTDTPSPEATLPVVAAEQDVFTQAPTQKPASSAAKKPQKTEKAPEEKKTETPKATEDTRSSDYLFDSSHNVIRESELEVRSREEIKLIYYEIYARHGYDFQDTGLKEYFLGKTWYEPVTGHREAAESEFNAVERENIEVIEAYQREQGWRQ